MLHEARQDKGNLNSYFELFLLFLSLLSFLSLSLSPNLFHLLQAESQKSCFFFFWKETFASPSSQRRKVKPASALSWHHYKKGEMGFSLSVVTH